MERKDLAALLLQPIIHPKLLGNHSAYLEVKKSNYSVMNEFVEQQIKWKDEGEVKIIKDVLRSLLNREPDIEDFKKVERQFPYPGAPWYRLVYMDEYLGIIKHEMHPPKLDKKNFFCLFPMDY